MPAGSAAGPRPLDRANRVAIELTTGLYVFAPTSSRSGEPSQQQAAVVRETRELELPAGATEVVWGDLPDTLRSETIDVHVTGGPTVVSQRFEETMPGPAGIAALLRGQEVRARPRDDERRGKTAAPSAARHEWAGAIVSIEGGLVLQVGKSLSVLPPSEVTLVDARAGLPKRRLVLLLSSVAPTRTRVTLSGVVERIVAHGPRYTITFDRAAHDARVRGAVTITNTSSASIEGAKLFLGDSTFEPFRERRESAPLDLATTWLANGGRVPIPFEVGEALRFSSVGAAEPVFLDKAHVPYTEKTRGSFSRLDEIRDKPEAPVMWPVNIAWVLDKAALGVSSKVPSGDAWLTDGTPGAPPGIVGRGVLFQRGPTGDVEVDATSTPLRVESKFLSGTSTDCAGTSKWEHAIPAAALVHGSFTLELPFPKKQLEVRIAKSDGVTVENDAEGSRIIVTAMSPAEAKKLGLAEGAPRKVVATYKTNRCK